MTDRTIEEETITNAQCFYIFDQYFDSEITLSVGVSYLFDIRPQRFAIIGGFESRLSEP